MPIFWSIILAIGLGGLCGAWMPVLPFIFILVLSCIGVSISSYFSSFEITSAILNGICVAAVLQISYVSGMFISNFLIKNVAEKKDIVRKTDQKLNADLPPNIK